MLSDHQFINDHPEGLIDVPNNVYYAVKNIHYLCHIILIITKL